MVDGVVLLDKPSGPSAATVSRRLGRLCGERRVGHGGTLDPLASGLLVVLLGQATAFANYVLTGDKRYRARVRFGARSTTDDAEGELSAGMPPPGDWPDRLRGLFPSFTGEIRQRAPACSALKHQGRPLYDYHRRGVAVPTKERLVFVHDIRLLEVRGEEAELDIRCGAGAYVRALARDWGEALGCGGYLAALRRTASHPFEVTAARPLDYFVDADVEGRLRQVLSVESVVAHFPALSLTEAAVSRLGHGVPVGLAEEDGIFRVFTTAGLFAGLATGEGGRLRPLYFLHWTRA